MSHPSAPPAEAGGFVMMPAAWLTLPVSPGARLLLAQFCFAANADGASWYSYKQLGEILGRTSSTVQRYVDELRKVGVITTQEQRTATRHNYRLKVFLTGWAEIRSDWRARSEAARERREKGSEGRAPRREPARAASPGLGATGAGQTGRSGMAEPGDGTRSGAPAGAGEEARSAGAATGGPPSPSAGRGVPPAGCRYDPSGHSVNPIDKNHTQCGAPQVEYLPIWTEADEQRFQAAGPMNRGGFRGRPDQALHDRLAAARDHALASCGVLPREARRALADRLWAAFAAEKGIEAEAGPMLAALANGTRSGPDVQATMAAIRAGWQDHWRKPPSAWQIKSQIVSNASLNAEALEDAKRFQKWAYEARIWLRDHHMHSLR